MVGTRQLARLLDHADAAAAKVVLVGDHRQLPEIDAGGAFRGLLRRLDPVVLSHNRRQRQPWERAALDGLRAGDPHTAIAMYASEGALVLGATADDTRERLVADWWDAYREAGPDAGVMIAARRSDVDDLNDRARQRLRDAGVVTGPALTAGDREFQAGDRIIALHNDRRLGVLNGTQATVASVDGQTLAIVDDDGRQLHLPGEYLEAGHVAHAYAITGHKAQGLTTEHAWVLGSDEIYREWGYVALSRGRAANRLYVVAGDRHLDADGHSHGPADPTRDAVAELARALERSRGQQLAIETAPGTPAATGAGPRRDVLHRLLAAAPADPQRELAWLDEERDAAHEQLRAAERRRDHAVAQQSGRGAGRRRRARHDPPAQAGSPAVQAAADVERWRTRLADIDARHAQLEAAADARAAWLEQHRDALDEARDLIGSEDRAARRRAQTAEFRLPSYLRDVTGPRPDDPAERRAWRRAVLAVERYRAARGIDHPDDALGQPPREGPDRHAYQRARDAVRDLAAVRDQVLTHVDAERELA